MDVSANSAAAWRHLARLHLHLRTRGYVEEIEHAAAVAELVAQTIEYPPALLLKAELHLAQGDREAASVLLRAATQLAGTAQFKRQANELAARIHNG